MSSYFLPEPYTLKFVEWGALVSEQLALYGVQAPQDESSWLEWARELHSSPELSARNIPDPSAYATWQPWAQIFVEALR